jgi:hypothetical protein
VRAEVGEGWERGVGWVDGSGVVLVEVGLGR